ncbi:MAG: peroxiredoxin family protein [Pirellulales bacterium]|nr:peroxiredoxin family protein [Pirellulales bacterium]
MPKFLATMMRLTFFGVLAVGLTLLVLDAAGQPTRPLIDQTLNRLPVQWVSWTGWRSSEPAVVGNWPPVVGQRYPDLVLQDQQGQPVRLSDFAGKVILLEVAAVPCAGCQAFAGGKQHGSFGNFQVQPGLDSIHHYAERFAGVKLGRDAVFVQLLLYGESMSSPTPQEVTRWAEHFQLQRDQGEIVLRGDVSMLGRASFEMIPGFHLIDRNFVLRFDSSGHQPQCDLYRDLLPALGQLVGS